MSNRTRFKSAELPHQLARLAAPITLRPAPVAPDALELVSDAVATGGSAHAIHAAHYIDGIGYRYSYSGEPLALVVPALHPATDPRPLVLLALAGTLSGGERAKDALAALRPALAPEQFNIAPQSVHPRMLRSNTETPSIAAMLGAAFLHAVRVEASMPMLRWLAAAAHGPRHATTAPEHVRHAIAIRAGMAAAMTPRGYSSYLFGNIDAAARTLADAVADAAKRPLTGGHVVPVDRLAALAYANRAMVLAAGGAPWPVDESAARLAALAGIATTPPMHGPTFSPLRIAGAASAMHFDSLAASIRAALSDLPADLAVIATPAEEIARRRAVADLAQAMGHANAAHAVNEAAAAAADAGMPAARLRELVAPARLAALSARAKWARDVRSMIQNLHRADAATLVDLDPDARRIIAARIEDRAAAVTVALDRLAPTVPRAPIAADVIAGQHDATSATRDAIRRTANAASDIWREAMRDLPSDHDARKRAGEMNDLTTSLARAWETAAKLAERATVIAAKRAELATATATSEPGFHIRNAPDQSQVAMLESFGLAGSTAYEWTDGDIAEFKRQREAAAAAAAAATTAAASALAAMLAAMPENRAHHAPAVELANTVRAGLQTLDRAAADAAVAPLAYHHAGIWYATGAPLVRYSGAGLHTPDGGARLRLAVNGMVETSQGVSVSARAARAALAMLARDELRHGETVDGFKVLAVTADTIRIGCHQISRAEVAALAAALGSAE